MEVKNFKKLKKWLVAGLFLIALIWFDLTHPHNFYDLFSQEFMGAVGLLILIHLIRTNETPLDLIQRKLRELGNWAEKKKKETHRNMHEDD